MVASNYVHFALRPIQIESELPEEWLRIQSSGNKKWFILHIYICNRKGSDLEYRKQQWPIEGEQTTRNNWYAMLKLFRETQQLKMNFELFLDFLDIY